MQEWQNLTRLTGGREMLVERVRLADSDVAIEGEFALPLLAKLTAEDQVFVAAFVSCHGSIKRMERMFGVSYPTIKNRLNRLAEQLPLVEVTSAAPRQEVWARLDAREISVAEALEMLRQ